MARFSAEQGGLITLEDLRDFAVRVEMPVKGTFRDIDIYTCGPWCQGPVVAQTLQMLEDDALKAMGHNSPAYIHLVAEALNLAFANREHFYGDPDFVDVPIETLLSKPYTRERRRAIDAAKAFGEMPPPGDPGARYPAKANGSIAAAPRGEHAHDTSYTCVVDRWGNAFSATPSDASFRSPIVPGLGFIMSGRGLSELARPRTSLQFTTLEAPAPDPESRHCVQGRSIVDALWLSGRRCAVSGHGSDVFEHRGLRHESASRDRGASVYVVELPQFLLAPHLSAGPFECRRPHCPRDSQCPIRSRP